MNRKTFGRISFGTIEEANELKSISLLDILKETNIDLHPYFSDIVLTGWIINYVLRHVENKMNLLLTWKENKSLLRNKDEFISRADNSIREDYFSTKIVNIKTIVDNNNLENAKDFLGALKLLSTLRNQLPHTFNEIEFKNYGLSLLTGSFNINQGLFSPNRECWILSEENHFDISNINFDTVLIDSKYVDLFDGDLSAYSTKILSDNRVVKKTLSNYPRLNYYENRNINTNKLSDIIRNIEILVSMVDLYLFPIVAKHLCIKYSSKISFPIYVSCIWRESLHWIHSMYPYSRVFSRVQNNKIKVYRFK